MREKNSSQRKTVARLIVMYCSMICFVLAGCTVLDKFSSIEAEALKYGTISIGAVRAMDYNDPCLAKSRKQLRKALKNMRNELRGTSEAAPQFCILAIDREKGTITLGLSESNQQPEKTGGSNKPSTSTTVKLTPTELTKIFKGMGKAPRPSETEMVGLRMAALKLIESELEDLNLNQVYDVNKVYDKYNEYRRMVVSLDCSAWVRGKAGAALVYIDLYPYGADDFCYKAAEILKKKHRNKAYCGYEKDWEKAVEKLKLRDDFNDLNSCIMKPPKINEVDMEDPVASCHTWLAINNLHPRIINVERMGKTEYLILAEGDYRGSEFGISGGYPIGGLSAGLKLTSEQKDELVTATVRPLSLAFIAGNRRAGWLFMPGKTRKGRSRMSPTERRLRMVVDIPKKLSMFTIHVHKVFLDPDLGVLPDARFSKQMKNLDTSRRLLKDADPLYEKYKARKRRYPSLTHYRLIKSRMRNLLHQGWSEEIVVNIPQKQKKKPVSKVDE